jgi:hypothetical protein
MRHVVRRGRRRYGDEAVRHLTVGVELTRHTQCAELGAERESVTAVRCTNDEPCVELGIVRCEDRIVEQGRQLVERCREPWGAAEHRAGDAVDVRWTDMLERPRQPNEG